jgi:ATP-dependent Clp protease protease subunit
MTKSPIIASSKCPRKFYAAANGGDVTIYIYDVITSDTFFGGVSATAVAEKLDEVGSALSSITLRVNSPGGDMFQGVAIKNLVLSKNVPVTTYVDGECASAASVVALAAKDVWMTQGSMFLIHNAMTIAFGNPSDLRKQADDLEKISSQMRDLYVERTGKSAADIQAIMDKGEWLDAQESVDLGLATGVVAAEAPAAPTTPPTPAAPEVVAPAEAQVENNIFDLEADIETLTI